MIITLFIILLGSVICTLKFFIETTRVLNGESTRESTPHQDKSEWLKVSPKDGGRFVVMLLIFWVMSTVFVGMSIITLPLLVASLVLTPVLVSFLIKKYVINDQVICFGASLIAVGIILLLFLLLT